MLTDNHYKWHDVDTQFRIMKCQDIDIQFIIMNCHEIYIQFTSFLFNYFKEISGWDVLYD